VVSQDGNSRLLLPVVPVCLLLVSYVYPGCLSLETIAHFIKMFLLQLLNIQSLVSGVILLLLVLCVRLRELIHHSLSGISSVKFVDLTSLFPSISLSSELQMTLIFGLLATLLLSPGFILDISL